MFCAKPLCHCSAARLPIMPRRKNLIVAVPLFALALVSAPVLAGCSPIVDLAPAQDSANPACAPMMIALPDSLANQQLRETGSQGTAAWGNPSKVVLRCGVAPPGPTTEQCVGVNGVDWLMKQDPKNTQTWTATTYGRDPATEILFNQDEVASSTVLAELAGATAKIPQTRKCLGAEDAQLLPADPSSAP